MAVLLWQHVEFKDVANYWSYNNEDFRLKQLQDRTVVAKIQTASEAVHTHSITDLELYNKGVNSFGVHLFGWKMAPFK